MADNPVDLSAGDIGKLSPIEQARLIKELRLSRQLLGRQSESQIRSPHLPPSSDDTTKGFDYSYWKDLITSLSLSYSDVSLIQAIRKAVSGQPAQIIGRLQVNCTLNDIFTALDTTYEAIHDEPAAWQLFYSVKQSRSESVVEWHTRLCSVWARIPDPGDVGLKIKKRLWTGLYSDAMKESSRQAPNDTAYKRWSCHSGLKLLCKLCRTSPPPSNGGLIYRLLGMPAIRTRWMAGAAAHKSG